MDGKWTEDIAIFAIGCMHGRTGRDFFPMERAELDVCVGILVGRSIK